MNSYDGEFLSRRAVVYTLDFETYLNFYGPTKDSGIIKKAIVDIADPDRTSKDAPFETIIAQINPLSAGPNDSHTKDVIISNYFNPDFINIGFTSLSGSLKTNETVIGLTTGTVGRISSISGSTITIDTPDGQFEVDEIIKGDDSGATINVNTIDNRWQTIT